MHQNAEILKSWKEIARYLDCGIRTAQRWERDLGLPVRRPRGRMRSAVIALTAELDDWVKTRATSAIVIDVSAASLPDAMARLTEHLQSRIDSAPVIVDVKIKFRLGDDGTAESIPNNGDGLSQRLIKSQGQRNRA